MYDAIVLSGCGVKALLQLGAIQCAIDKNMLINLKIIVGTSAGGMIAYLLAIGYTPIEILVYISVNKSFEKIKDINMQGLVNFSGIFSYSKIQSELETMTINKIGYLPTMKDIYTKFGKDLRLVTYNETINREEVITYLSHADIPCLSAVRMTSNLPFVFERYKYGGSFYIDGGISNNFPINLVDDGKNRVLGIVVSRNDYMSENEEANIGTTKYLMKILYIPVKYNVESNIRKATELCDILRISNTSTMVALDFGMSSREKLDMFSEGYSKMFELLNKNEKSLIK